MLRIAMQGRGGSTMVSTREDSHHHRHQLLPAQLFPGKRCWWVVQPSSPTLRFVRACVRPDCVIQGRCCTCALQVDRMHEERMNTVYHIRVAVLQDG
ncbi:hypothetical protein SUGI_0781120 [Cryptomeria japonica]|nr:hypothetical protein SUGI_0781120 [Cryptomeria japonica]